MLRRQDVNYKKKMHVLNCWPNRFAAPVYTNPNEALEVIDSQYIFLVN